MTLENANAQLKVYQWQFISEANPRDLIMRDAQGNAVLVGRLPENETELPSGTSLVKRPEYKLWAKDSEGKVILCCFI